MVDSLSLVSSSSSSSSTSSSSISCKDNTHSRSSSSLSKEAAADPDQQTVAKLTRHIAALVKSLRYLEQIVRKEKYEILGSVVTAIFESVLDLYNQIRSSSSPTYSSGVLKVSVNEALAALVEWSDRILLRDLATVTEDQVIYFLFFSIQLNSEFIIKGLFQVAFVRFEQFDELVAAFLKALADLAEFYKDKEEAVATTSKSSSSPSPASAGAGQQQATASTARFSSCSKAGTVFKKQRSMSTSSLDHRLLVSSGVSSLSSSFR